MKKLTTDEFIKRAKSIHGNKYIYDNAIYVDVHTPVEIICPIHGVFKQALNNHMRGAGCSICNKQEKRKLSVRDVISRFRDVHGDKYDYMCVKYKNSKTAVDIICPIHGVFKQTPYKHMTGHGCPKCCLNYPDDDASFIFKARQVHGELYDYSKVHYVNSQTKVCIIDRQYGEFWQKPYAHLNGEGHPKRKSEKCYNTKKMNGTLYSSKPEMQVKDLLYAKFGRDDVLCQYMSQEYPFACDFYIKSLDLYIELNLYVTHGGHWFDATNESDIARLNILKARALPRNMYEKMIYVWTVSDINKRNIALQNSLNYLVFWEYDLSDFMNWYELFDKNRVLNNI